MKSIVIVFVCVAMFAAVADALSCPSSTRPGKTLDCPLPNGICCTNADFCCPQGYVCGKVGRCTRFNPNAPSYGSGISTAISSAESSVPSTSPAAPGVSAPNAAMQQVIQSASQVAPPPVDPSAGSSAISSSSDSVPAALSEGSMPGTDAVMQSGGSADVPRLESSSEDKNAIVILKNVNSLYKGPPKNGAIQPITEKDLESSESSGSK